MPTSASRPKTPATFARMWASALLFSLFPNQGRQERGLQALTVVPFSAFGNIRNATDSVSSGSGVNAAIRLLTQRPR